MIDSRAVRFTFAGWFAVCCLTLFAPFQAKSQEDAGDEATTQIEWPRSLEVDGGGTITFYQPQVEDLVEDILSFRTAVKYQEGEDKPLFGAMWFESTIDTDQDAGTALVRNVKVTKVVASRLKTKRTWSTV